MQRARPGRVQVKCVGCGMTFESIRSQIERRNGGKFHDRECWRTWRARNKQTRLAKLLKAQYNLTLAEYQSLYDAQDGACGICRYSANMDGPNRLVVDHDHVTGRVRGLLCRSCNLGLGNLKDDPSLLASAIRYLAPPIGYLVGGPVWHASVAPTFAQLNVGTLRELAFKQLAGLGDPALGEWTEWTGRAYHLRRRLTEGEAKSVGPVIDVRGTYEGRKRLNSVRRFLPEGFAEAVGEVS